MEIINKQADKRINAYNILLTTTLGEYYSLFKNILENNEFQRKRVKSSSTVYSLLKEDLQKGCLIPSIILALDIDISNFNNNKIVECINENKDKIIILDGLQRTYTIFELIEELETQNKELLEQIKNNPLRIELYTGMNKIGILYRMLTLNTGQTPMSARHQIEIIYSDYKNTKNTDIKLFREIDGETPNNVGEYKFNDVIDGFTSYINKDFNTIERIDILDNIKSLEKLSKEKEQKDLFKIYLNAYNSFVKKMCELGMNWLYDSDYIGEELNGPPFGKTVLKIFNKSQCATGFGAAIGKWIEDGSIKDFRELIEEIIPNIHADDIKSALNELIFNFDIIRTKAKKIGVDQRLYFFYLIKFLFDKEGDAYLNFDNSIRKAIHKYNREL